jgi:hypothetical protein
MSRAWLFQSFSRNCRQGAVRGKWTCWPVSVCLYISNMDLPLWVRKSSECLVRGSCNYFAVTADKGPCVVHGFAGLALCVCVYVFLCISEMDLALWARKCSESLVRGSCNYFAVTANKGPCVVHGHDGLSLCVCLCVCLTLTCRCGRVSAANVSCVIVVIVSPKVQRGREW